MANNPYWNKVVLAMHMDDVGLTDLKGHAITKNGTAARSSTQSKAGGYSAYFDGTATCYLSIPYSPDFDFGSGDFTIEWWQYKLGNKADYSRIWNPDGDFFDGISVGIDANGKLSVTATYAGSSWDILYTAAAAIANGSWLHLAVVRSGGSLFAFENGVKTVISTTLGTSSLFTNTTKGRVIGGQSGTARSLYAFVDDFIITKQALYTTDFSASLPPAPFPDTVVQLSGTVKDASDAFVARTVRAYRRSDGAFAGSTVSNATTGAFSISALDNTAHFVECQDSGSENALIFDNIMPV